MDQEAFRNLISSSSAVAGPSSSTSNRSFGKAPRRNPAPTSTTKPSDLKPRKLKSDSSYIDRASARRSGRTDSEFTDIEALHNDFETRIAAAETEEERQKLREQISSVGGDAKHSVLVKGLDWALLAQNRARIERENGAVEGEGELEQAYQVGRTGEEEAGGKRSREKIVEAIKRRREGKPVKSEEEGVKEAKRGFRPVGFKPIGAADKQEEENAEYKWVNGKRMRKKKKPEAAIFAEPNTSRESGQARAVDDAKSERSRQTSIEAKPNPAPATARITQQRPSASPPARISASSSQAQDQDATSAPHSKTASQPAASADKQSDESPCRAPAPAAKDEDSDDDEDIFADVGGWDGIPEAKDEDEEADNGTTEAGPVSSPVTGRTATPPPSLSASSAIDEAATLPDFARPVVETLLTAEAADESSASRKQAPSSTTVPVETLPAPAPAATDPTPSSKPKKSKWDDDEDDQRDKKKKKKKHH